MAGSRNGYLPTPLLRSSLFHEESDQPQVQVPLSAPSPALPDTHLPRAPAGGPGGGLSLPSSHLTPTTLLGAAAGSPGQRETLGHLYAAQMASHLLARDPDERRTLVLGLGLRNAEADRSDFFDVLELALQVL